MRNYLVLAVLASLAIVARGETLTYSLSGTINDPSTPTLDGQWDGTVTLDTATSPNFYGSSDPSYAFNVASSTLELNGVDLTVDSTGYIQYADHGDFIGGSLADFVYFFGTNGRVDFLLPFPFTSSNIGTIQPLPSIEGGTLEASYLDFVPVLGSATLTAVPLPPAVLAGLPLLAGLSWHARRRRSLAA